MFKEGWYKFYDKAVLHYIEIDRESRCGLVGAHEKTGPRAWRRPGDTKRKCKNCLKKIYGSDVFSRNTIEWYELKKVKPVNKGNYLIYLIYLICTDRKKGGCVFVSDWRGDVFSIENFPKMEVLLWANLPNPFGSVSKKTGKKYK